MYKLSLPANSGGGVCFMALAAAVAAAIYVSSPAWCAQSASDPAGAGIATLQEELQKAEEIALLARAQSLEVLGQYLWETNLSASRTRSRAAELRRVARVLLNEAREDLDRADSKEELALAARRLEIVQCTSSILEDVADRLERTRGTRRKIRILGLELSRHAWTLVRDNALPLEDDLPVLPGQLFKDHPPGASPREHALLKDPDQDFVTYKGGAISTEELVLRTQGRKPRPVRPLPEEKLYYSEGAITLSPFDRDHRSKRIWWSPPPEELAWKVEQW
jgi:hypothetical protein